MTQDVESMTHVDRVFFLQMLTVIAVVIQSRRTGPLSRENHAVSARE